MVKIAILANKENRTPQGIASLANSLTAHGCKVVGSGTTTITIDLEPKEVVDIFGVEVHKISPQPPSEFDFGAPGGFESEEIVRPDWLQDRVEQIAIIPPATRYES